jgi:hypothetical protein
MCNRVFKNRLAVSGGNTYHSLEKTVAVGLGLKLVEWELGLHKSRRWKKFGAQNHILNAYFQ